MKVFEQSIVHCITKPRIFNGIIFSNSSEFKTIIPAVYNFFSYVVTLYVSIVVTNAKER